MRSPWGFFVSASVLLISTHGAAAADPPSDPAVVASVIVDEIQSAASTVRHQLQAARAQRNVIKTVCLNDKLTQLDVATRSAREQRDALLTSVHDADAAAVAQARARLDVYREQGRRVAAEAHQCVGMPEPPSDDTGHTSMTSPPLPGVAEYPGGDDVFAAVQPPIHVSAFK